MVKMVNLKRYDDKELKGVKGDAKGDAKAKIKHYIVRYNKRIEKLNVTINPRLKKALAKGKNKEFKIIRTWVEECQKSMGELKKIIKNAKEKNIFNSHFAGKMLLGKIADQHEELKDMKRYIKELALTSGIASEKSINNAYENLVNDMIDIREKLDECKRNASDENVNKVEEQINERKDKKCFYRASSILKKAAKYIEEEAGAEELVKKAILDAKTKAKKDYNEQNGKIFNAKLNEIKEYSEKNCESFVGESGKEENLKNIVSSAIQMTIIVHICKELGEFIRQITKLSGKKENLKNIGERLRAIEKVCGWKLFATGGHVEEKYIEDAKEEERKEIAKAEAKRRKKEKEEREERKKAKAEAEEKRRKEAKAKREGRKKAKAEAEAKREDEVMGELDKKVGLELEEENKERKKRIAEAKRKKKEKEEKNKGSLKNKLKNSFVNMWKK